MNRQQIKQLAIAAMTIDHIALLFVPSGSSLYYVMWLLGRLTAPIMALMLTEGYRYTRSRSRYLMRLVVFALISRWRIYAIWESYVIPVWKLIFFYIYKSDNRKILILYVLTSVTFLLSYR